jgi:predicted phosphoribosyltransferase
LKTYSIFYNYITTEEKVMQFKDRFEAGEKLAKKLLKYSRRNDVVILALPRGGVPAAYKVAFALKAPMDIFLVRKLGVPGHEELAMGAIASGGVRVLNDDIISMLQIPAENINEVTQRESGELNRREKQYRGSKEFPDIKYKIVILIDDGLATGASMRAAVSALRLFNPGKIVIAVPVASSETIKELEKEVDEIVTAFTPEIFGGVGEWYDDFSQTTDDEVVRLLREAEQIYK